VTAYQVFKILIVAPALSLIVLAACMPHLSDKFEKVAEWVGGVLLVVMAVATVCELTVYRCL